MWKKSCALQSYFLWFIVRFCQWLWTPGARTASACSTCSSTSRTRISVLGSSSLTSIRKFLLAFQPSQVPSEAFIINCLCLWSIFRHLFNHHTVCVIQDSQKRINWREAVHDWIAHPVPTGSSESDSVTEQTVQQRLKGPVRVLVVPWQDIQDDNHHGGGRKYANQAVLCHPEDFILVHLQQVEKRVHWFLQNVQV